MNKEEQMNFFEAEIAQTIRFVREGKISASHLAEAWRNICFDVAFRSYEAGFNDGELGNYAIDKWVDTCQLSSDDE